MMDFNERVIPGVSANFLFKEALARYEFARKYSREYFKVLDVGCGTGYGTTTLKGKKIGIDINKEAIDFARKKYPKQSIFKVMDIKKMRFKKASFDLIVSFEVIEHLKNQKKFLKDIKKLLRDNGVFIMSTPNASVISPKGGVASPYHTKEFDFLSIKKILTENFGKIEIFGEGKSVNARKSWKYFMKSQEARQNLVNSDKFGLRRLVPKRAKEELWKYFGALFGRQSQEKLTTNDFPISKNNLKKCYYFVAVCRK